MVEAFFFLWEERTYRNGDGSSSHEVFKGVRALQQVHLSISNHNVATEKNVDQALIDLCNMGIVKRLKPTRIRKKTDGRPPKFLFKVISAPEMMPWLDKKLSAKRETLFRVFGELEDFEAAGNSAASRRSVSNG